MPNNVSLNCWIWSKIGLGPFFPMYFPLPRGKRYLFCGTKVVEIKKAFSPRYGKIHRKINLIFCDFKKNTQKIVFLIILIIFALKCGKIKSQICQRLSKIKSQRL